MLSLFLTIALYSFVFACCIAGLIMIIYIFVYLIKGLISIVRFFIKDIPHTVKERFQEADEILAARDTNNTIK